MKPEKQELFKQTVTTLLQLLGEDPDREGLRKTPERVMHALTFMTQGYTQDPEEILNQALFESSNREMVVVRDIEFYSLCEHHLLPIIGRAHVAYIPNGKVVGLSKLGRMVDVYARRLQIQEQLTEQIAHAVMKHVNPLGCGVVLQARHMCMEMRGVEKINANTISSALRGIFLDQRTRDEFFTIINTPKTERF
jgi:GTP cyclohydrolase IA